MLNHVMKICNCSLESNQIIDRARMFFLVLGQIYTDNTENILKSQFLVVYSIHVTVGICPTEQFRSFPRDHGHNLVGLIPVGLQVSNSENVIENYCSNSETNSDEINLINGHIP